MPQIQKLDISCPWGHGLLLMWLCHQLLSWFLTNVRLHQVSSYSIQSANDKGGNEVKPVAVHRSVI
jgi:hypothetical protein